MFVKPTLLAGAAVVLVAVAWSVNAFWNPSQKYYMADGDNDAAHTPMVEVRRYAVWEAEAGPVPAVPTTTAVEVKSGDSLMQVLTEAGIERRQAHSAIQSLRGVYDPRRLRVGDELRLKFAPPADSEAQVQLKLVSLTLPLAFDRDVAVRRRSDGTFSAEEVEKSLDRRTERAVGEIGSSLFVDGSEAGVPAAVLVELIRIYSFAVDFQREIQRGDRFELMFDRFYDRSGATVSDGAIHYAKLTLSGKALPLYRYTTSDGDIDYFNEDGESVRKALMRTPIDGARLSSRFGKRKHPILGYTRLHAGTDFAAPSGTPIYAAGNGVVEAIGRNGGYGNYIRLRHNSTYQTAYAHMKGYARGLKKGTRVRQGQVIGYVGTTGRSTGPHLHYEVHRDRKQINPLTLELPSGEKLSGDRLAQFQEHRQQVDTQFADASDIRVAGDSGNRP